MAPPFSPIIQYRSLLRELVIKNKKPLYIDFFMFPLVFFCARSYYKILFPFKWVAYSNWVLRYHNLINIYTWVSLPKSPCVMLLILTGWLFLRLPRERIQKRWLLEANYKLNITISPLYLLCFCILINLIILSLYLFLLYILILVALLL